MENLGLSYPAKIDVALPANKVCGLYNLPEDIQKMLNAQAEKKNPITSDNDTPPCLSQVH